MPALSIVFIRAALIYFCAGISLGSLLLLQKALPLDARLWLLRPVHIETMLTGWTIQLVMGVAYWMFPRFAQSPRRGHPAWPWLAFVLLNAGILMIILGTYFPSIVPAPLAGRALQFAAVACFAWHLLPRVRAFGDSLPAKE